VTKEAIMQSGFLGAIFQVFCMGVGLPFAMWSARRCGKQCSRVTWKWLAIPLGIVLGGAVTYILCQVVVWLIMPAQFFKPTGMSNESIARWAASRWFFDLFWALPGCILGGLNAGGIDVDAKVS
jgi:ABC-type Co2+ transport system permease subunit